MARAFPRKIHLMLLGRASTSCLAFLSRSQALAIKSLLFLAHFLSPPERVSAPQRFLLLPFPATVGRTAAAAASLGSSPF